MKKKLLATVVGLATLTLSSASYSFDEGEITIWINGDKSYDGIAKIGKKFEADTGVKVNVAHPDQVEVKYQQTAAAGQGPDLFMWAHDRFGEWVKAGLLHPLDLTPEYMKKFSDLSWSAMEVDGKYYGYPVSIEAIGLICNKDIVKEAPKNFEDFAALDKELSKKGIRAIMWDYGNGYFTYPLIAANGGYVFKKVKGGYDIKDIGVNNEGSKKGLNLLTNMIKTKVMEKGVDYGVMESNFVQGKVACIINGPWSWGQYENKKMNISVNPIPAVDGKPGKAFVGVLGMTINAGSPNKDLAKEFMEKYLLTDEGLKAMNDDKRLGVVGLKSFQAKLEADPKLGKHIATTMANAQNGDLMPSVPEMNKFWSAFTSALSNATSGRQSVDDALNTAESRIR